MNSTFRIDYVEAALIELLKHTIGGAYADELGADPPPVVDIESLGDQDFNEDGQLVMRPPSIRVRFLGDHDDPARDNQRLTYQSHCEFELLCCESSLRSHADQRRQTLVFISVIKDQATGARINLADGTKSFPISLIGTRLLEGFVAGVDEVYSVRFDIEGFAQFSGVNSQLP